MAIIGLGGRSALFVQSLVDMRSQLGDLQRQLGTGKKADSFAGLGLQRGLSVSLRAQLESFSVFSESISNVSARIGVAQTVLTQIDKDVTTLKNSTLRQEFLLGQTGQTVEQQNALTTLDQLFGMLNARAGDRYVFSGAGGDQRAVEHPRAILDGAGNRAGFRQIVSERRQADLGATGLGRLVVPVPGASIVSVAEDFAGSPFGFKLVGVTSTLTGAAATGPAGAPSTISVDLAAATLSEGETIRFSLSLPDGSAEDLTLTATASATPGPNQFTIGATANATAANLQSALATAVAKLADTSLAAASSMAAANDFFNLDAANPPRRVAGPPFNSATTLIAGTTANTVTWYIGEAGASPARDTATARIDETTTVSYGMRANEQALRSAVASMAAFATMTFSTTDANARARFAALQTRTGDALNPGAGQQSAQDIAADLANAQRAISAAKDRNAQTEAALEELLNEIEGVKIEEVGAKILALQTRLQASMQTTAMLTRLSLVDYI